jgi:hypothetical protein
MALMFCVVVYPHPLIVTIPTAPCLVLGFDALAFGPLSALGLRVSLLDFFCDFAMGFSFCVS